MCGWVKYLKIGGTLVRKGSHSVSLHMRIFTLFRDVYMHIIATSTLLTPT